MANPIIKVSGELINDTYVFSYFGKMDAWMKENLVELVEDQCKELRDYIIARKLSGDPLKKRTGNLQGSIGYKIGGHALKGSMSGQYQIGAEVGNIGGSTSKGGRTVDYARFHEYGYNDTQTVKGHYRHLNARFMKKLVVEKRIKVVLKHGKYQQVPTFEGGYVKGKKLAAVDMWIRRHDRTYNYAPRPFMKPSFMELWPKFKKEAEVWTIRMIKGIPR